MALGLITSCGAARGQQAPPSFTWDNLAEQWDQLGSEGFSGVVLVTRDDETVLHRAYGLANREREIANDVDTIFAIGSTPIDFTKVGILLLADQGELRLF
jgi:CubicO group peptidase (beta-lactamase class C family)